MKEYVLTQIQSKLIIGRTCRICKKHFRVGDRVCRTAQNYYHEECYRRILIDVSDDILTDSDMYFVEHGVWKQQMKQPT